MNEEKPSVPQDSGTVSYLSVDALAALNLESAIRASDSPTPGVDPIGKRPGSAPTSDGCDPGGRRPGCDAAKGTDPIGRRPGSVPNTGGCDPGGNRP